VDFRVSIPTIRAAILALIFDKDFLHHYIAEFTE